MAYYNCSLMSDSEIQERYPNLLKEGYTPADIRTEITAWQDKQRKTLGESYKYDTVPSEEEIYNRIEEKKQILDKQEAKQWNRYSDNNYEVSSEGDKRFSA